MFDKVTHEEFERKLKAFARYLGLQWYHNAEQFSGEIKASMIERQVSPCISRRQIDQIDECAETILDQEEEIRALREDLALVMKHLGIKIEHGKRVVIRKKGEKNASHAQAKD